MCGIYYAIQQNKLSSKDNIKYFENFMKVKERGPDYSKRETIYDRAVIGFHRLALNDLTSHGNQPWIYEDDDRYISMICNGEIYNHRTLEAQNSDIQLYSSSDCEIILGLYRRYGMEQTIKQLDGEFAIIIHEYDKKTLKHTTHIARDYVGVRPMYYGYDTDRSMIVLSSELKGISAIDEISFAEQLPPGQIWTISDDLSIAKYIYYDYRYNIRDINMQDKLTMDQIYSDIRDIFTKSVKKRLMSDRPLGSLLSGGLDSSLVSAVASDILRQQGKKLTCFTMSFDTGGTDLPFAKMAAGHIGAELVEIYITAQQALDAIDQTIYTLESYDTTEVRASVMQYLIGQYISRHSDIKALLVGEMSDELMAGYMYSHLAPDVYTLREDNIRLVKAIYTNNGLRADRCMAANGLEVRLPFSDRELCDYIFTLPPELTAPSDGHEKYLIRRAFSGTGLLPDEVLWRTKEALSDGTSHKTRSRFEIIQDHIDTIISDTEFVSQKDIYTFNTPDTKEKYYYRKRFGELHGERFANNTPFLWMPQRTGETNDPSARTLQIHRDKIDE